VQCKKKLAYFCIAEPHPILLKDSERQMERQMKTKFSNVLPLFQDKKTLFKRKAAKDQTSCLLRLSYFLQEKRD
jgi:hypothetical protein